ncbi:DoxX family protein [Streptomyces sp. NPDC001537]
MTTVLAVTLSLVFLPLGLAKLAATPVMRQAAAHLGMTVGLLRVVGALELAGVAGLLTGLAWMPLGVAAATGLALLMVGAAVVHLRLGDPLPRAAPAVVMALISLTYAVTRWPPADASLAAGHGRAPCEGGRPPLPGSARAAIAHRPSPPPRPGGPRRRPGPARRLGSTGPGRDTPLPGMPVALGGNVGRLARGPR